MAQRTKDATAEHGRVGAKGELEPTDATLFLHAEFLDVRKRRVSEKVVVRSETRSRQVTVEEPLEAHQVVVEHVHIGRFVETMPPTREEGDTAIVPIVEEVAVVVKRLFLSEEVHIHKVRSNSLHRETVTLREQHAVVTRTERTSDTPDTEVLEATAARPDATRSIYMEHEETLVAVYDTATHAEAAISDLQTAGIPNGAISMQSGGPAPETAATLSPPVHEQGFWSTLFGGEPDHDTAVYARSVQGGSSVVTVQAPAGHATRVMEILEAHHPIDIDERASSYGLTQTVETRQPLASVAPAPDALSRTATADPGTIQLSEEQLAIGKRVVNRGGTRIRRFVVETPVEEQVTLHDERVTLERHPVTDGRAAVDSFSEKAIEMTASSEEVVVSKTARVVEEVGLRKEATDRVETVHDTVRKEEVEIEQIPARTASLTETDTAAPRAPKI